MNLITDAWNTLKRRLNVLLREPIFLLFELFRPLIWLLLFSQLFEKMAGMSGFPTESPLYSYRASWFPGSWPRDG